MPYADPEKKRQYMKEYNQKWYIENRESKNLVEKAVKNKRTLRLEKRQWLLSRLGGCCEKCGTEDEDTLDIHHTDPTYKERRDKQTTDYSWGALLNKAHTLQLLCSNCHRKHHAEERRNA